MAASGIPRSLRLTATIDDPELAFLPWDLPLEEWSEPLVVALPRGISRHVVRFVSVGGSIYAVKEAELPLVEREYHLLGELSRRDVPCVDAVAVVADRTSADGEPLPSALVTRHLPFSLPYRAVFSTTLRPTTANRLLDALALLLVRLHLVGFAWNDCSLSNTLFRRDAGAFAAYLVDAETGETHDALSDGQREYDLDTATTNVAGELMDLEAGNRLHPSMDPVETGMGLRERYERLWSAATTEITVSRDDRHQLDGHIRRLNGLGFDVAELTMRTTESGDRLIVTPKVVDVGHHSRRLIRLTGIDAEEKQAQRLLNDLDSYVVAHGLSALPEDVAAHRWVTDRFEVVVGAVPGELRGKLDPAQVFHEFLEHRWFLSERAGQSVPAPAAIADYIDTVLRTKPDERSLFEG